MWLRKHNTPGAAPGGFTWDSADHVLEVPDELGEELLAIGGFDVVEAPVESPQDCAEEPEESAEPEPVEVTEVPAARKRPGRKPAQSVAE